VIVRAKAPNVKVEVSVSAAFIVEIKTLHLDSDQHSPGVSAGQLLISMRPRHNNTRHATSQTPPRSVESMSRRLEAAHPNSQSSAK
jgi:hypothetical protein